MYRTNLRLVAAGAALASLLALTGCGGSDDKSSDDAGSGTSTSSSDSTASSDSTDGSSHGKDGKGDKGKGSDDSTDGSGDSGDGSSDSTDGSSDGSDDKTQAPVPLPKDFPTDEVPPVDGDIVSGNYSKKPLSWNLTVRDGKNVSREYDAAAKLLTDAGCKVEIDKAGSGTTVVGQLTCAKYDVLLAVSATNGIIVTYSVSQG